MSLINEALKKVQNQQGGTGPTTPPGPPDMPHAPNSRQPEKGKHRSFIWGFVVAVLVVGLVTTLLTTFFVWQILGTEEPVQPSEPVLVEEAAAESEAAPPIGAADEEPLPSPSKTAETSAPEQASIAEIAPAPELTPVPVAEADAPAALETAPEPTPVAPVETAAEVATVQEETPSPTSVSGQPDSPKPPDPAVMTRLQQVQIRGIMSGGIKVLIHDAFTGQTRAYRAGEALEGTMGLVVVEITPNTIQFKDYAGSIHTKSF